MDAAAQFSALSVVLLTAGAIWKKRTRFGTHDCHPSTTRAMLALVAAAERPAFL